MNTDELVKHRKHQNTHTGIRETTREVAYIFWCVQQDRRKRNTGSSGYGSCGGRISHIVCVSCSSAYQNFRYLFPIKIHKNPHQFNYTPTHHSYQLVQIHRAERRRRNSSVPFARRRRKTLASEVRSRSRT